MTDTQTRPAAVPPSRWRTVVAVGLPVAGLGVSWLARKAVDLLDERDDALAGARGELARLRAAADDVCGDCLTVLWPDHGAGLEAEAAEYGGPDIIECREGHRDCPEPDHFELVDALPGNGSA